MLLLSFTRVKILLHQPDLGSDIRSSEEQPPGQMDSSTDSERGTMPAPRSHTDHSSPRGQDGELPHHNGESNWKHVRHW